MRKLLTFLLGCLLAMPNLWAQSISVDISKKQQQFFGAGGTCDSYIGHWLSMSDENRLLAAKMVAEDIHLDFVKHYINGRPTEENEKQYNNFTAFVEDIRKINPDIKVQMCVQDVPEDLRKDQDKKKEFDDSDPDIYDKMAQYYYEVIEGFHDRGVQIDELDILNEPGGTGFAVYYGGLYKYSVPKLREMIEDPTINTKGMKMPHIGGTSQWSVLGVIKWFDVWKADIPGAYEEVDVVSTHGYRNGWDEKNYKEIYDYIDGLPFQNNEQTGKLQKGDGLYEIFEQSEPDYIGDVSIGMRISDAINGGVNHFFIFNINNSSGNNAALLQTPSGGAPIKSKVYDGFKQLTSSYPLGSYCLPERGMKNMDLTRVLAMRDGDENVVYLNITNIAPEAQTISIDFNDNGTVQGIAAVQSWVSSQAYDIEEVMNTEYTQSVDKITFDASPFSVNTLKITLDPEGAVTVLKPQTIEFLPIDDQLLRGTYTLKATASSGLDVQYEVVDGPAVIQDGVMTFSGEGYVKVRAYSMGNEEFDGAASVIRTFKVETGALVNVAEGKTIESVTSQDEKYPATKLIDGDKIFKTSRWITVKDDPLPHEVVIDLEESYDITGMGMWTGSSDGEYSNPIVGFVLSAEVNGEWVNILEETNNRNPEYIKFYDKVTTQKVKLQINNLDNGTDTRTRIFEVEIYAADDTEIDWDLEEGIVMVGDKIQLEATSSTENSVTFASGNEEIATIDEANVLTVVGTGNVQISATTMTEYGVSVTFNKTLKARRENTITWDQDISRLAVGGDYTLNAKGGSKVKYLLKEDSDAAILEGTSFRGNEVGNVTVIAYAEEDFEYVESERLEKAVVVKYQDEIVWDDQPTKLKVGEELDLTAFSIYNTQEVSFIVSDASKAVIEGGKLIGKVTGEVTVKASTKEADEVFAAVSMFKTFTVESANVTSIDLDTFDQLVYPNPSNGLFQVKNLKPQETIHVFNGVGVEIKTIQVQDPSDVIDLNDLPKGIYYIKTSNNVGNLKVIIK
ncbi:discoidin domain-containing protein [Flammeovirga aprica]|uniref:T9SS type A sorting domain-containing protein n=1 Tax=Flammeovirga aprica JL-4 TaxID=694437 RepID=A0A7X9S1H1_9BACT|nr:discoidin domain-containing protein [Flammeovirga aprica]NME72519.1 T9SS type A sorting domain-containing protein [Flammeovirga aprica JL-4]